MPGAGHTDIYKKITISYKILELTADVFCKETIVTGMDDLLNSEAYNLLSCTW